MPVRAGTHADVAVGERFDRGMTDVHHDARYVTRQQQIAPCTEHQYPIARGRQSENARQCVRVVDLDEMRGLGRDA